MSIPDTKTLLTGLAAGPIIAAYNHYTSPSRFANVEPSNGATTGAIFILILLIAFSIGITYISCKAVYNLTDSVWQTICYFLFGFIYLYFAILYYGLSGYKFKLSNSSLNNRN
jgi:hypothetical protein